jgi:hypothetical protein
MEVVVVLLVLGSLFFIIKGENMGIGVGLLVLGLLFFFSGISFYGEYGDAGSIFLIVGGVIFSLLGGFGIYFQLKDSEQLKEINNSDRQTEAFTNWIVENLSEYNVSFNDLKPLYTGGRYYIFNRENMKLIFINYRAGYDEKTKKVLDYFDHTVVDLTKVRKISLKTNEQIIGEVTKANAVGRALVGGALFGGAGAVVGSTSAKQTQIQTNEIISIKLEVITTDIDNPYSTILLYDRNDLPSTNFEQMEHSIQNLYWSLENSLQPA